MWKLILLAINVAVVLVILLWFRPRYLRMVRLAFIRFGERLKAPATIPHGRFKFPFINAKYKGFPLHVRYVERGKHGKYSYFEMDTGIKDEFWFTITGGGGLIRTQDVNVGMRNSIPVLF